MIPELILSFCFAKAPVFEPLPEESVSQELPQSISGASRESGKPDAAKAGNQEVISGVVRIVRGSPRTEVFFVDRKDSLVIPEDSHHNEIFDACLSSSKTRSPISLVINPTTRTILSISKANSESSAKSPTKDASSSSSDSQKESSRGTK